MTYITFQMITYTKQHLSSELYKLKSILTDKEYKEILNQISELDCLREDEAKFAYYVSKMYIILANIRCKEIMNNGKDPLL